MYMWQRSRRVAGVLVVLVLLFAASGFAEERMDELDKVVADFQLALLESDLLSWSTDIDVLIAETLGARFGWDSVAYKLISSGELEILCPDTARALKLTAELGVARAMWVTLGGLHDMDGIQFYKFAVLRAWVREGMQSGLLSGDVFLLTLRTIDHILGGIERTDKTGIDEALFLEYVDFYKDISSTEWIDLLLVHGMDGIRSVLSVFWESRELGVQPRYDTRYIDSFIIPAVIDWFSRRADAVREDLKAAVEEARAELNELKVIITGKIEFVDYFGNLIEGPSSELVVSIAAGEKTLDSSLVYQNRFVLEISGKDLAQNYPSRLNVFLEQSEGSALRFSLYEDLPVSLMLDDYSSRWVSEGLVVFTHPDPIKVQVLRDLVRFEVLNSDLIPQPGVVVTVQEVQLPTDFEGVVEVEGMPAGTYEVIAGLSSELVDVTYGTDPLVVQIVLPREDEILSVPEERTNHFAHMILELRNLEKALMDEAINLPDFFTYYNLSIRKAKEESMWLAAAWSRYKDIRERNLQLVLRDQDERVMDELSQELSRELARINAQWFAGQDDFLRTADEVLQKYLAKRAELIQRLHMLEERVSSLVEEAHALKISISSETTRVLEGIDRLQGMGIEVAASSMSRDLLEEGRAALSELADDIEESAKHVQDNIDRLSVVLDELFLSALEYERLYEAVTGEIVDQDIVRVYREGLGVLRNGEALRDSNYRDVLDIYGKEVLLGIEKIIDDSNRLSSISTEILGRVSELPTREELDEIKQSVVNIKKRMEPILERMPVEIEGAESEVLKDEFAEDELVENDLGENEPVESELDEDELPEDEDSDLVDDLDDIELEQVPEESEDTTLEDLQDSDVSESVSGIERETMALQDILQLFELLDEVATLRQETVNILVKDGIYEDLETLIDQGKSLIGISEYIFDDVLDEWEQAIGFVIPVLEEVALLRQGLAELENDVLGALGARAENRSVYQGLYDDGMEFVEKLQVETMKLRDIAEYPSAYAEDERYEEFTRWYAELEDEYMSRWTGLTSLPQIDNAWAEFSVAYRYSGVEEARRVLEERRKAVESLEVVELVFNTDVDLGIDFAAGKTVPLTSTDPTDLTIVRWDEPRAFVPEGSGIKDLGLGTLSTQFELSSGSYSDALYLQAGHVYVIRQPDGMCAKLRVDEIIRNRRSIAGKLTSMQYTIKLSYLYPIPEQLFQ